MIKAIFFDIDGTLVNSHSKAHETTKEAIRSAQQRGILCGVATGRGPVRLERLIDYLNLDVYIAYNGQLVYTEDEVVYAKSFCQPVLEEIVSFAEENRRQILFGSRDKIEGSKTVRFGNSKLAKRFAKLLPKKFPVAFFKKAMRWFSGKHYKDRYRNLPILQEPIYQCILISPETEKDKLIKGLPNCEFQRSNPYSVDVIPKGGSKIKGIEAFAEANGIKLSEVMAFGDHFNDIEMLSNVGVGVAMGNAQDRVKEIADFVTHSNEEDGIAYAMKHFGVID